MSSSIKPATRYTNKTSLTSSTKSDPSSSSEFSSSRAISKKNDVTNAKINFGSMVKKFVENNKAKNYSREPKLVVAADFLAKDLKRNDAVKKGSSGLSGLHKKLFKGSKGGEESSKKKALTEVKSNTRTLAMVLRSERELLSLSKEQEGEIAHLKILLEAKNGEVEKLKDLCLKQREEIKSLKSAILFPDVTNSQIQDLLEKQSSELIQAKQLIPNLQKQVTSLTGQLQFLAEDLAEVKAEKYSGRSGFSDSFYSSPRTPSYDQEDSTNSLFGQEYSSGEFTYATPESPDDMILKDLNPCLTPYYAKTRSKDFDGYEASDDGLCRRNLKSSRDIDFNSCVTKISKSSESCQSPKARKSMSRAARSSDHTKCTYGRQMHDRVFKVLNHGSFV